MAIKLQDMLKKAQDKGLAQVKPISPWQSNSYEPEKISQQNLGQTRDKPRTNLGQSEDKPKTKLVHTQDKPKTQTRTKHEPKQSSNTVFFELSGLQRKIILYIHQLCSIARNTESPPISIENIASYCNTTVFSARKTIQRLVNKNCIFRKKFKAGRGGWTCYEINEDIYQAVLLETNLGSINDKPKTQLRTSSSNSSSNINTTTKLLDEWQKINFESIKEYGFNEKHILQISKIDSITPDELQDSINYFAFDLLENDKAKEIKKSPVAFFMGILRGQGIYTAPKNYESPQARKLRLKIEQQKAEQEKIEKLETELINNEFNNWRSKLTDDKVEGLLPEEIKNATVAKDRQIRGFLREYFIKTFWDTIKQEKHGDCFS